MLQSFVHQLHSAVTTMAGYKNNRMATIPWDARVVGVDPTKADDALKKRVALAFPRILDEIDSKAVSTMVQLMFAHCEKLYGSSPQVDRSTLDKAIDCAKLWAQVEVSILLLHGATVSIQSCRASLTTCRLQAVLCTARRRSAAAFCDCK